MSGLWHAEGFDSTAEPGVLEAFLKEEALPYWRSRGFNVKVFVTQYSLGPAQFWLLTELEGMGSFEGWQELAEGEPRGAAIMQRLVSIATNVRAGVVRD